MHKKPKDKKILIFKILGISLPFLLFVIIESSLRLFNYGNKLDVFIPYDVNGEYLMFNHFASQKYFNNSQFAPRGNQELFKKNKDKKTFRIFVLGESTTIGFPYFHNGSFHRWLQYRLMQNYPEKNFEIINLSLTAVNSYTVLGFSKEVINFEPDMVLIYTGHNEYYGALGVGSSQLIGSNPWMVNSILTFRELRTVQLMTNGFQALMKTFTKNDVKLDASRMELMVEKRQIPYQSNFYEQGIDQFQSNMNKTLEIFEKKNIPVFIGNLISNEKDLAPFTSASDYKTVPKLFSSNFKKGEQALKIGDSLNALNHFKTANTIFSEDAKCNYYLGLLNYSYKDYKEAKVNYTKAKDLDELRFRAPSKINKIIAQLANDYSHTHLVDVKKEFENHSYAQILGEELLIDHVHPNIEGFALMSNAFYSSMKQSKVLPNSKKTEMSFEDLIKEMPITKMDSLTGEYIIHRLKGSWPFNDPSQKQKIKTDTQEQRLAVKLLQKQISWREANDSLYAFYKKNKEHEKARKISEALVLEYSEDPVFYDKAAELSAELGKFDKAAFYFSKSFDLQPTFNKAKYLFVLFLKMDKPLASIPFLDYAISNNTNNNLNLGAIKALVKNCIELKEKLTKDPSNITLQTQIANAYLKMGNKEGAMKYIDQVLLVNPKNKEALAMFNILNPIRNNEN